MKKLVILLSLLFVSSVSAADSAMEMGTLGSDSAI